MDLSQPTLRRRQQHKHIKKNKYIGTISLPPISFPKQKTTVRITLMKTNMISWSRLWIALVATTFLLLCQPSNAGPALKRCIDIIEPRNTENCSALMGSIKDVVDCGPNACYNFCNKKLSNCCPEYVVDCPVNCASAPKPVTITSGCQAPPPPTRRPTRRPTLSPSACKRGGGSCTSSKQCCSQRCRTSGICI